MCVWGAEAECEKECEYDCECERPAEEFVRVLAVCYSDSGTVTLLLRGALTWPALLS